ncbi:MAG: primosomal protein N' [Bauldia sp.]|nr:primosomal protein N' [Bauldia sp.]
MQTGGPTSLPKGGQLSFDVLDAPASGPADDAFDGAPAAQRVVSVLIPLAVEGPYSYRAPRGMRIEPGSIVQVPLGTRSYIAAVWDDAPDLADPDRLRDIEEVLDTPPLGADTRRFVDWVADYTLTPRGMILRMVLRSPGALAPEPTTTAVRLAGPLPERLTPARLRVLELLSDHKPWARSALTAAANVSSSVVAGLVDSGTLEVTEIAVPPVAGPPDPDHPHDPLTREQAEAARTILEGFGRFSATVLDGVTGSGKTETYFEAVAEALRRGKQVLILLPEIALTADFLDRFARRFGTRPAPWHSELPPRIRERVWRGVASGELRAVAGARSALFLPYPELGLIVVDEEHDGAYKQDEGVTYHARDMAVVRASLGAFPVVLASATPSIETRVNADLGRYQRVELPGRFREASLPEIGLVDLKTDPPERGRWLAPRLVSAIGTTLAEKQQALLFLNRRGYAPLTLCRHCGHRFQCPNCSTWLVEHRFRGVLACHHCGHTEPRPKACPECGEAETLVACGPGVERLAEEVAERFPDARTIVLSSDLLGSLDGMRQQLAAIAAGAVDIVIGTQLVAKGHNFPLLTLVGVVDADLGFAHGDMRAAERTFQILSQVTGRAGRAGGKSLALLQTYAPEHPVLQAIASGDREAFYAREIAERREARLPPFVRLAALIISATERADAREHAAALRRTAPAGEDVLVLGPAEAPLALVRGRYRYRLLVQVPRSFDLQSWLRQWLAAAPAPRGSLRVQIDIDPQSFL